jgi:aldehyde dehydrogenase (NAD+)
VVEGVVDAIWFNQGQVCCAGSRILVQEGVADRLVQKLRDRMEKLRVGDPLDKGTDIGAIVAPVQLERIQRLVEEGRGDGATIWQPSWSCPRDGWFYPPTLITDVSPAAAVSQVEIFGPVVVLMTFRTPAESVELANNSPYGLAASVWTENVNLALDIAPKLQAGTVWVNSTNLFDAAAGFGGYRESGFGREGGREGLWEYLEPRWHAEAGAPETAEVAASSTASSPADAPADPAKARPEGPADPPMDRTPKLYIGGRQVRPDSGYALDVTGADGRLLGEVARGNRKDVRNAVEAAHRARPAWARSSGHGRAQVLYYLAENLSARAAELAGRIDASAGVGPEAAEREVDAAVRRLFSWAAWADKWDGAVHHTPFRNVTIAMPEPLGVVGVATPERLPLLGLVSAVGPLVAMGNAVVAVPGAGPLVATDFYQVLDTSDVPAGVVNILTGDRHELVETLAGHYDVDGLWYFGADPGGAMAERLSADNMKRRLGGPRRPGLVRPRPGRRPRVPAPGHADQEHLGPVRRMSRRSSSTFRVRYSETDQMGVAYHANYLAWCEVGRTDFIRELGTTYAEIERMGCFLAVAEASVRYSTAARYDDVVRVETRLESVKSRAVTFRYDIFRQDPAPVLLASARTTLVSMDRAGKSRRLPDPVLHLFKSTE